MKQAGSERPFLFSWAVVLVALVGAASIFPPRAFAQGQVTSAIVGQVSDRAGNGIPGAIVTVTDQETGQKSSTKTDGGGHFSFTQLKPGIYSVKAEAQGFRPEQQGDNNLSGEGQKQTVNLTLHDGFW